MNAKANPNHTTVHEVFGEFPEDVLSTLDSAATALVWVEVILLAAEKNHLHAKKLVAAAKYIAGDFGNHIGCVHENMCGHMREHDGEAQT